jgi:pimeloyl-ACP methyl ester carboxylesterase
MPFFLALAAFLAAGSPAAEFSRAPLPRLPVLPGLAAAPLGGPSLPGGLGAPPQAPGIPGIPAAALLNQTAGFKAIQKTVRDGAAGALPPEAAAVRYLLVPGFSWRALPGYFGPNLERLAALGLDAKRVDTNAFGRVADNARLIREEIAGSDKPVVLIGHSRGGLEALEALRQDPALGAKVRAVVTLQSPWGGTPAALLAPRSLLPHSHLLSEENLPPSLPEGVLLRSVATSLGARTLAKPLAFIAAGLMRLVAGKESDGVVPTDAAIVPGAVYARLEHVGHWDTVARAAVLKLMGLGAREHDGRFAADFTEAVVRWLFSARP